MKLYHASNIKDLKILKPQRTISNDKYIGDYVFATSDRKLATMYLVTKGVPILMVTRHTVPKVIICANQEDYILNDNGGAVYEVSSKGFIDTPQDGLSPYEKVLKLPVTPLRKTIYSTSLNALRSQEINVYFVDKEIFNSLLMNPDQSKIIDSLEPYTP